MFVAASSSDMACEMDLSVTREPAGYGHDVPPEMRGNYYLSLLLNNLNLATTTEILKSVFGSLPRVIYTSVDVDTVGKPMVRGRYNGHLFFVNLSAQRHSCYQKIMISMLQKQNST